MTAKTAANASSLQSQHQGKERGREQETEEDLKENLAEAGDQQQEADGRQNANDRSPRNVDLDPLRRLVPRRRSMRGRDRAVRPGWPRAAVVDS